MALTVEGFAPGGREPFAVSASRVLVRDAAGVPLILACEYGGGVFVAHYQDPDFEHLLQTFGHAAPADLGRVVTPPREG